MAKIYKNAAELVGNTPLLEVGNLEKELGLEARILVKLEYFNPEQSSCPFAHNAPLLILR